MTDKFRWQTKLHARLHDPAEKALVLLRDPVGHEGGTSRVLWRLARHDQIIPSGVMDNDNADVLHAVAFSGGIEAKTYETVQRADWWAAAADRPQWPMQEMTITTKKGEEKTIGVASWARVNWAKHPVLIHPLTGKTFDLSQYGDFGSNDLDDLKSRSFTHFSNLLIRDNGETNFRKSVLAFWRFGPEVSEEIDNGKLGPLWNMLPADTRVPDHSIWDHLDLTSAFAGAFAADPEGEAALLSLAIGPVQPFIASARKMDDLWAGSHLLARLSWEAMRVVCEQLGPDAILFPRLRGVPQVDLWLRDECGLPSDLFKDCDWQDKRTDSNPLFSAALPNRFVAVVPRSQAKALANSVEKQVRQWLQELGEEVVTKLLTEAGYAGQQETIKTPYEQMKEQLQGFPEVHWAAVPFSLIKVGNPDKQTDLDVTQLSAAMQPFFNGAGAPGFLATPAWKLLQKNIEQRDEHGKKSIFFAPNPGVLYPAVHDLAERVLAAAKSTRTFRQCQQQGWRCSLTGETEWLTTDRAQLKKSYRQQKDTLWAKVASKKPAWAKSGEHLGALPAIKRLWPSLFAEEVGKALHGDMSDESAGRFVVSTHTMALAHQLDRWIGSSESKSLPSPIANKLKDLQRVALPHKLAKNAYKHKDGSLLAKIPAWLDAEREKEQNSEIDVALGELKSLFGAKPETYYGLILLDGDHMGQWLAGGESKAISYLESFHPKVRDGFNTHAERVADIKRYGDQKRALSPNRHLAISAALNDFSLTVVRHVVEEEFLGRLIYAGGDDVFAMLPVADLLPAMQRLRYAYSGHDPEHDGGRHPNGLTLHNGFAVLTKKGKPKLMRMMGTSATASCGAVIAHHQAPLAAVRAELESAEKRAKNEGRNRFSITVIKRSGGALRLTEKWGEPVNLLMTMRDFLAQTGVSRRAVYHTLAWLNDHELPLPTGSGEMLKTLLTYQLDRQAEGQAKNEVPALAQRLTQLMMGWNENERIVKLRNFLSVAEFLARETRTGGEV
ncbi:MAG: type III-B CRISPR-associated protein Cas10/Cmr2 [Pseudohongiella sp.]|nr:type III-B CRISPR-associated protein Cas10/Cmr2 [Pseudohongiella sp.]